MKPLSPLQVPFEMGDTRHRLDVTRYSYTVYQYQPDIWGGSLVLDALGCDPLVPVPIKPDVSVLQAALKAIKAAYPRSDFRRKVKPRRVGFNALFRAYCQTQGRDDWQSELKIFCAVFSVKPYKD